MNKNLWSVSYVLVTSSSAFFVMTLLYVFVDVLSWWSGAPLRYAGKGWILATQFDNWLLHLWKCASFIALSSTQFEMTPIRYQKNFLSRRLLHLRILLTLFFSIVGMNAILLYVGHVLAKPMLPFTWSPLSPTHGAHYAMNITSVIIWIIVAWILYRFKVFLTL